MVLSSTSLLYTLFCMLSLMEPGLSGVYVAGDITFPTDAPKMNLIANGFGQAAVAVVLTTTFIYPKLRVFPGHSSQKMQKSLEIAHVAGND